MPGAGARRLERWVAWRCRVLALPYGDQALLIGKEFYREIGGYRALPLMEDVDLVRRIGRARLVLLDATSDPPRLLCDDVRDELARGGKTVLDAYAAAARRK
mgnify:CR=1 FL=1